MHDALDVSVISQADAALNYMLPCRFFPAQGGGSCGKPGNVVNCILIKLF